MVSYYNSTNMYRHQQEAATAPMHSWYAAAGYHHQGAQMAAAAEQQMWEPQMWHHHHGHSVFNGGEFPDFVHSAAAGMVHAGDASATGAHTQLMPSPTVSGSEMSSPGAGSGNISPHQTHTRPPPARSPFEWIKKTSYQSQPNPEFERKLCAFTEAQDSIIGKTRTKDKYRVVYTDFQRIELEKEFMLNNRYITIRRKSELAANLGLSERQIKIWFQNRRAKERKQNKKRLEERMGDVYQQDLSLHHHHQDQLILGLPAPTPSLMMSMNSLQLCSENVTKTEINDTDNMV